MTITCEYSHNKWNNILYLLNKAKTFKTKSSSSLRGRSKINPIVIILIVCNTGNDIGSIACAIKSIERNCIQNKGKDTVKVTLSHNIYSLINQLSRLFKNHTNNSPTPLN